MPNLTKKEGEWLGKVWKILLDFFFMLVEMGRLFPWQLYFLKTLTLSDKIISDKISFWIFFSSNIFI